MALVTNRRTVRHQLSGIRGLLGLAACLMVGGCAQLLPGGPDPLTLNGGKAEARQGQPKEGPQTQSELEKATDYWGKQYAASPRELKIALNFARNLKAMGDKQRALAVLQQASIFHGADRELAGEYGRLALDLDQVGLAGQLLAAADDPVHPDWRVISARGTVLAKQGKYAEAIPFYDRALTLAHDQPSILSNLALATAMSGDPAHAETLLRRAETADGNSPKIRQNLALVLGLQGKYDEAKLIAARDIPMESAAQNSSFLRQVVKLEPKAMPITANQSVGVAEAPAAQSKAAAQWGAAHVREARVAKASPAAPVTTPVKPEPVPVAEAAPPAIEAAEPKPAPAAQAAASLPWGTDLKQADVTPAPTPISAAAEGAPIWTANVSTPAKTAKAKQKPDTDVVTHRDIDLSLRAPEPMKKPAAAPEQVKAATPTQSQSWTPQVATSGEPRPN